MKKAALSCFFDFQTQPLPLIVIAERLNSNGKRAISCTSSAVATECRSSVQVLGQPKSSSLRVLTFNCRPLRPASLATKVAVFRPRR